MAKDVAYTTFQLGPDYILKDITYSDGSRSSQQISQQHPKFVVWRNVFGQIQTTVFVPGYDPRFAEVSEFFEKYK